MTRAGAADVLGRGGTYFDPVWRIEFALTALESRLITSHWVRRLAFVSHAGASSITTTQSYSRLEHSLGLLALAAHFAPEDRAARATALLHDIGHLPFSHTLEGLAGLDHHALGAARVRELGPLLLEHGVDADEVIAIDRGERASVLHNTSGNLTLDHLDSFVRSGRSHGRTTEPPPATLRRLRVTRGSVDTDAQTARYLGTLIAGEARSHLSEVNIVPNAVLRHLAATIITEVPIERVVDFARLSDDQVWALLLQDPRTSALARALRDDPEQWDVSPQAAGELEDAASLLHSVNRLYLDLPLVDGESNRLPMPTLPPTPISFRVTRRM